MDTAGTAAGRFDAGYSCSQAVFSALGERWGIPLELSLKIAAGFGGGMGRSAQTCGCVTGAIMAIGLAQSSVAVEDNRSEKEKTYGVVREFLCEFESRHGATLCRDLLGCDISTAEGLARARQEGLFAARCPALVRDAVAMVERILDGGPPAGGAA